MAYRRTTRSTRGRQRFAAPARRSTSRRGGYASRASGSRRGASAPTVRLVIEQAGSSSLARPELQGMVAKRKGRASM